METTYSNENGTSTIVYKIDKWSVRNTVVRNLNDALIYIPIPSPVVLKISNGVNRNSIDIIVSDDITPSDLEALDSLVKVTETILYDKLSESLRYM